MLGQLLSRINTSATHAAPPRLAFMHVPKTSGTALMAALRGPFGGLSMVRGFDLSLYGGFNAFETMAPHIRQLIYKTPGEMKRAGTLAAGHFALSTLRAAYPETPVMTVLREPASRLLSHWLFWRQHTDEMLAPLGSWADYVRISRAPLVQFLSDPRIACQTDNVALRMLLWPHPHLPADDFINPADDAYLLAEARQRLRNFDFCDIVENPRFIGNLEAWLGRRLDYGRLNETKPAPRPLRAPLQTMLTAQAETFVAQRTRLDAQLWQDLAARHTASHELKTLRLAALRANLARFERLMAA